MPKLINKKGELTDHWQQGDAQNLAQALSSPDTGKKQYLLLDWAVLSEQSSALKLPDNVAIGVLFSNTESPQLLEPYFKILSLICLEFPLFTDGRGYSQARMLREIGFTQEIRATGDVLPDQLYYMARCGFNTFLLAEGKSTDTALKCLKTVTVAYQSAADGVMPVYKQS